MIPLKRRPSQMVEQSNQINRMAALRGYMPHPPRYQQLTMTPLLRMADINREIHRAIVRADYKRKYEDWRCNGAFYYRWLAQDAGVWLKDVQRYFGQEPL